MSPQVQHIKEEDLKQAVISSKKPTTSNSSFKSYPLVPRSGSSSSLANINQLLHHLKIIFDPSDPTEEREGRVEEDTRLSIRSEISSLCTKLPWVDFFFFFFFFLVGVGGHRGAAGRAGNKYLRYKWFRC